MLLLEFFLSIIYQSLSILEHLSPPQQLFSIKLLVSSFHPVLIIYRRIISWVKCWLICADLT